ncbi:MAG TPA: cupin domain-containing protein [Acidobacteriaceae bacterium]
MQQSKREVNFLDGYSASNSCKADEIKYLVVDWTVLKEELPMPFVDVNGFKVIERLPGWKGRYFHSASMTFAHYEFTAGSSIHEHFHPEEEVYEVIEGELQVTIDGISEIARPGVVAIVPPNARHSVKALTDGRLIVVDHPARPEFGQGHPSVR